MNNYGVYILYSPCLSKFYTGSCKDVFERIDQHLSELFTGAFTATGKDWIIYFHIDGLAYKQARRIEAHIKRMKSKKFIEDLKKYPELVKINSIIQVNYSNKKSRILNFIALEH